MTYNPKNYEERHGLEPGTTQKGEIVDIQDGKIKDFVKDLSKWEVTGEEECINLVIKVTYDGESYQIERIFRYREEGKKTVIMKNSNLAKYKSYYNKVPELGDKVNMLVNAQGYWRLIFE